jgi:UDP-3-O-[3-hydroxymyristoyl] glucosamine N-acyltransferase
MEPVSAQIGDARFFARRGPHSLATVAKAAIGVAPDLNLLLTGVAPLHSARPDEVSFLDNRRYASMLENTAAGAVIVHPDMLARVPETTIAIVTKNPYEGWARAAALFHPAALVSPSIHPSAFLQTTRGSAVNHFAHAAYGHCYSLTLADNS